jgi:FixJ family two-component response regulator
VTVQLVAIIDDDEDVRVALSSLIRSLGYEALAFSGAAEFLASPRLEDISCAVADAQMPGMTGLDLQRELVSRRPNLPIIFVTGFPDDRTRVRAEQAGAVGFFSKPIDSRAFIECLRSILRRG